MKKFFCLLCFLLLFGCLTAALLPASAADNVIFISDSGTGDGSSPENAMGPGSDYTGSKWIFNLFAQSPINRAIGELAATGGTVVICGPVTLKWAFTNGNDVDELPIGPNEGWTDNCITITSLYDGIDYRQTTNAALVLTRNANLKNSIAMQCASIWENVTLRVNHAASNCISETNFYFACNGKKTELKDTFVVEAYLGSKKLDPTDPSTNSWFFPLLYGDNRYRSCSVNPNVTINGGTWQYICGGIGGFNRFEQDHHGLMEGDSNITFGGTAYTIDGISGGSYRTGGRLTGDASVTITGGTVCGNIDIGGIGGFADTDSTATLTVTGGNFDKVITINDISGAAGWNVPKATIVDCSGFTGTDGKTAMEQAEELFNLITFADLVKMPDGSERTFNLEKETLPEGVIEVLRKTPYTRDEYKAVYDSILAGERLNGKMHTVIDLLKMLSAPQTNAVEGFDVPANTDVMREKTIEYFDAMSKTEWIAPPNMDYTESAVYTGGLIYEEGKTYVGMPYTSARKPSASIEEFCSYLDAGSVYRGPVDFAYLIGIDCGAPRTAWAYGGALCNSGIHADDFQLMVNWGENTKNVIDIVGNYNIAKFTDPNAQSSYDKVCAVNGADVMYEAYALARPCDFIGSRFFIGNKTSTDQHLRMVVEDAVVFRNGNGVISGSKSYLILSEQTSGIHEVDGKKTTWLLNQKHTFNSLFNGGYIPMTTKTLKSGKVEAPTLTLDKGSYSEGSIDLVGRGTVRSNYVLFAINASVTDQNGKEVASAVAYPYALSLNLANTASTITTPPTASAADKSRDQGMSSLNKTVQALPSGTYTYTLTATIGFGTKTVARFDFTR